MKVSVGFPTCMEGMAYPIPFSNPEENIEIAKHAESLGYDSIWGNDHMTTQKYVRETFDAPPNFWEPLITYSFIAAETTKLRMGTSMLVLPMRRDIVVTAKQLATLDWFSKGRLEVGIGVGAYREEFEALHPEWKVHRGEMVEEGIQALRRLLTEKRASFDGKYYKYKDVEMFPKTFQESLPLYIGGNHPNALRRTAKFADGWIPACVHIDRFREDVRKLRKMVEEQGRDFSSIEVAPQYIAYLGKDHEDTISKFRQSQMYEHLVSLGGSTLKDQGKLTHEEINLVGDIDEVIEKSISLREAGATHLLGLYFAAADVPELLDQMQIFAEEVMPELN